MSTAIKQETQVEWQPELIRKYDVPGPRYTSYPTAVRFSEAFDGADYRHYLRERPTTRDPLSLYVHLPFCHNVCYYCACNKVVTRRPGVAANYLSYLFKEIAMVSECIGAQRPVTQLHFGGGTPTYLTDAELTELMHELASHFNLIDDSDREYSIEVDPRTVGADTLALLRGLGFNRVSLGVQDFDPEVQKSVNREQPYEMVAEQVEQIRRLNYKSMSFDLIYGLPYQSQASMERTLKQVIGLQPDRISCYNYAHLPERFPAQRPIDRQTLPSAQEKLAMLGGIISTLCDAGYRYIGMDHFVRPDDELARCADDGRLQRNFQGYSTRLAEDLIGLGVSSIGNTRDLYVQNARELDSYYALLDEGEPPVCKALHLNDEDRLRRDVIMELICRMSLDKHGIEQRYQIDFDDHFAQELKGLEEMASEGLLELDDEIRVTRAGRPLVRNICMLFDQYTGDETRRFSRTI